MCKQKSQLEKIESGINKLLESHGAKYRVYVRMAYSMAGLDRVNIERDTLNNLTPLMSYADLFTYLEGFKLALAFLHEK